MKVCSKCRRDDVEFNKNKAKKDGLNTYCKGCSKSASSQHYEANRSSRIAYSKSRKESGKEVAKAYIASLGLICKCGENHPACMDFHHVNPDEKIHEVSMMVHNGYPLETIKIEIAKCLVLCSNCHRKEHYNMPGSSSG